MKKVWMPFNADCQHCGAEAEVFTDSEVDNVAYDGDVARCVECGMPGQVSISEPDDDGDVVGEIVWHDEPDCDCEWCLKNGVKPQ